MKQAWHAGLGGGGGGGERYTHYHVTFYTLHCIINSTCCLPSNLTTFFK